MKIRHAIASYLLAFVALAFTGCASLPKPAASVDQRASTLRALTSTGAVLALRNNPRYIPAVDALATEIISALDHDKILSAEVITDFITKSALKHGVDRADVALLVSLGVNIYTIYAGDFNGIPIKISDPVARAYIQGFANGLTDATRAFGPIP